MPNIETTRLNCKIAKKQPKVIKKPWGMEQQQTAQLLVKGRGLCLPTTTQEKVMVEKVDAFIRKQQQDVFSQRRGFWGGSQNVDQYQAQQLLQRLCVDKYGLVSKDIVLPRDSDVDNITMQYQDDLISITIPKMNRQIQHPSQLNADIPYTRRQPQVQRPAPQQYRQPNPWLDRGNPFGFW